MLQTGKEQPETSHGTQQFLLGWHCLDPTDVLKQMQEEELESEG